MVTKSGRNHAAVKAKRINWFIAVLAVLAGGMIYILCRPIEITSVHWIRSILPVKLASLLAPHPTVFGIDLPGWIVFSLPDGLWAFAYTLIVLTIWLNDNYVTKYFWYATIPILTVGSEILQWPGIIPGTFCVIDLVFISLGVFTGILIALKTLKPWNHESKQAIFNAG